MISVAISIMKCSLFSFWVWVLAGVVARAESQAVVPGSTWQACLERSDLAGKVLSQTRVQVLASGKGEVVRTQLLINMADSPPARFWTVSFETAPEEGLLIHSVRDSGLLENSFSNGNSSVISVYLCEANQPWKGSGRYPIMVFGKNRLTLELKPSGNSNRKPDSHVALMWIELTRKGADGSVVARSSAPWFASGSKGPELDLALPVELRENSESRPLAQTFNLSQERLDGLPTGLKVRVLDWARHSDQLRGVVTYNLMIPLESTGIMLVYEQDGERVEAKIRPPGEAESSPP